MRVKFVEVAGGCGSQEADSGRFTISITACQALIPARRRGNEIGSGTHRARFRTELRLGVLLLRLILADHHRSGQQIAQPLAVRVDEHVDEQYPGDHFKQADDIAHQMENAAAWNRQSRLPAGGRSACRWIVPKTIRRR